MQRVGHKEIRPKQRRTKRKRPNPRSGRNEIMSNQWAKKREKKVLFRRGAKKSICAPF
jgi:hypothetical protein